MLAPLFDERRIDRRVEPTWLAFPTQALGLEPLPDRRRGHEKPVARLERLLQPGQRPEGKRPPQTARFGTCQRHPSAASRFVMLARAP